MKTVLIFLFSLMAAHFAFAQTNLIAHYPMDGDGNDVSAYQNNGTLKGGVTSASDRFGNPCGALEFNGSNGYITVPSSPSLKSPTKAFSVSVWIMPKQAPMDADLRWLTIVCKSDQTQETDASPQFRVQSTRVTVSINTEYTENTTQQIEYDKWHFYSLTYDGATVKAYLNGQLIYNHAYATKLTPNNLPMEIGRDVPGNVEHFCGIMDDLKIYNGALTAGDIAQLQADQSANNPSNKLQIYCPQDVQVAPIAGQCDIPVNFPDATATDPCGVPTVKQIQGLPSGSIFPAGQTIVSYQATNSAGFGVSCSFTITVPMNDAVAIQCPQDIVKNAAPGDNFAIVPYPEPMVESPCSPANLALVSGLQSGAEFPIGRMPITYSATNQAGKQATCSFTVQVNQVIAPSMTCPDDIFKTNDPGTCDALVQYALPTVQNSASPITPKMTSGLAPGSRFPVGTTTVKYSAQDAKSRSRQIGGKRFDCEFKVVVEDQERPTIECPEDEVVEVAAGQSSAKVQYIQPLATDNCPDVATTLMDGLASGSAFPIGRTEVVFVATDKAGNSADCKFTVTVTAQNVPITLDCPQNITIETDPGECAAVVDYPAPQITGPATLSQFAGLNSGESFPKGITQVKFQATGAGGEMETCGFTVKVLDREPPVIECPQNITKEISAEENEAKVTYPRPTTSDNCGEVSVRLGRGGKSGGNFPIGVTENLLEARDRAGNKSTCTFEVTVIQTEPVAIDPEIPDPQPEPDPAPEPPRDLSPTRLLNGDTVIYTQTVPIHSKSIRIYYYDDNEQDGDIVSINFDGEWLVNEQKIKHRKKYLDIELDDRPVHFLLTKAHNEGKKPWNTLKVSIIDGSSRRMVYDLSSREGRSSGIKLVFSPK